MKKLLAAVALSIALPALAHAQTAPASAPEASCCCCEKMKAKMDCCKGMAGGDKAHAGHDMTKSGATAPQADPHKNHQQ